MGCDGLWSYLTNFVMRLKLPQYCGSILRYRRPPVV